MLLIVLGGHETTARLMLEIIYSLCNNKDLIEVLNKETDDYIKSKEKYDIDILDQNY